MLAFLLQANFATSQPDSDVPLTRKYVEEMKYFTDTNVFGKFGRSIQI